MSYDGFARVYDKHWGDWPQRALPDLDRMGLGLLSPGDRVLDLCCGTGRLAALLAERVIDVVGIDASSDMIEVARENAPSGEFLVADAATFTVAGPFAAATSTFDALNHIIDRDELAAVFARVNEVLVPGGLFLFDLNVAQGFRDRWRGSLGLATHEEVVVAISRWDERTGLAEMDLTIMVPSGDSWQRRDLHFVERAHPIEEVVESLAAAGFVDVETFDSHETLGWRETGRVFVACRKAPTPL
jgi:SAM-dependent methyltransferase